MTSRQILEWLYAHAVALWPIVSALLIIALRTRSPEEWIAMGERSPRVQGVIRLLRAVGLDPAKALSALAQIVTGRARAVQIADTIAPPAPSKVPAPIQREGERGSVRVSVLVSLSGAVLVATLAGALLAACPGPVTPVDGGPAVTPSSWTSTARVVITTLRWALPAARAITDLTVAEPGRTQVARALDAAAQATDRMHGAVDAYEARGGDRCAARAAVGGLQVALVGVAQVLADNGIALGTTLERIVDAVASISDALIPACDADAGWAGAGDASNARLRAIAEGARARGVTLRRVLDDLRPLDAVAP